jgi:hypothetical protein
LAPTPASAVLTPPEFMLPDPIAPVSVKRINQITSRLDKAIVTRNP